MSERNERPPWEKLAARAPCPERAARRLVARHADGAGEEALMRALRAEQEIDDSSALFWVDVYTVLHRLRHN